MTAYSKESDESLLQTFRGWFKHVMDVEAEQRAREVEDLRFQVGEYQWDDKARQERLGKDGASGRPTLSVSLVKQPMQLVKNQAEAADLGVEIHPVSEKAEKDIAETMQDHYREIERDSGAEQVRLWAFDRGLQCGRGYWRVDMVYDEDSESPYDQKISINRVLDGSRIGFDPAAQKQDLSDANYGFAYGWLPFEDFRDEYPDDDLSDVDDRGFAELAAREPDWVMVDDGRKAIQVVELWRRKHKKEPIALVKEGKEYITVRKSEVGRRKVYAEKVRDQVTLCWYKFTAFGILEQEEWGPEYDRAGNEVRPGLSLIPIIPFHAIELQLFDGKRRVEGMVRGVRDPQRAYNYAISAAVEDVGRLSKIPYVGPRGAFTDPKWASANTRNWSFIEYDVIGNDGGPIPKPEPMQVDGTKLGLSIQLAELMRGASQIATAIFDPSLGKRDSGQESAKHAIALQQQADAGTSNFLQTLANISMRYEARVVLERMVYGYDRPGRIVTTRGPEGEVKQVMLNAHFRNGDDGRPVRVRSNTQGAKLINYRQGGKYGVAVSVGKAYQTRLQQGQEEFGQLLPNLPPELQILLLPTYMRFRDSPGSKEAADLMAKFRDAKFGEITKDKDSSPTPEQLSAQVQGQQQKLQEMGQQLQAAIQQIQTDMAKQQAAIKIAEMNNAARIEVARISAAKDVMNKDAELKEERLATGLSIMAESAKTAVEQAHETRMQHQDHAHEVGMAAAGGNTMTRTQEGGQEHGQEQSQEGGHETSPQADGAGE